ncbi:YdaU family protein [Cupriavidus pauculus]|nr:DUF1376 domain-containing protein [Cupriavidus pauculus]
MSKAKDKADVWMPLFIGDYLADTGRLTTEQHGAYLLLLMDYWRNGPPPNDDATLAQIARLAPAAWKKCRPAVLRFFTEVDGLLHQKRIDHELEECQKRKNVAVAKATVAAQKRWGKQSSGNAPSIATSMPGALPEAVPEALHEAMLEQCPSPSPSPTTSEVSGVVNPGGIAQGGDHATSHLQNKQTGEENARPVQIRILLRQHGMPVTSNSAEVLDMVRLSVTDLEITETVDVFRQKKPGDSPNAKYILSMIVTAREKAAKALTGDVPTSSAGGSTAEPDQWWMGGASVWETEGARLGVKRQAAKGEQLHDYMPRVIKAAGEGPWREWYFNRLMKERSSRYAGDYEYVYGFPPIGDAA